MKLTKLILVVGVLSLASISVFAQEDKDRGSLSAGFETNTYYYIDDEKNASQNPDNHLGSNNYLKLDYSYKAFTAGVQVDAFLPPALGLLPMNYNNNNSYRVDWYAGFQDKGWDIKFGSLFEQYGSGLLFRTYEDRALGVNNALRGIKVGYTFGDYLNVSAMYGLVRDVMTYTNNSVAGADLSFSLSRVLKSDAFDLAIEGSYLDKYEDASDSEIEYGAKLHTTGYSARLNFGMAGVTFKGEYMRRDLDRAMGMEVYALADKSEAIQLELGYSGNGFGGLATFRKLTNPFLRGIRSDKEVYTSLNYVPALTQQHTYALATLNPYTPQADEIGGQVDLFYNFKKNSVIGGRRGMKVHANFSTFYGNNPLFPVEGEVGRLFQDLTLDVERWFGKNFKMILYYTWQYVDAAIYNYNGESIESHTVVADLTYKFNRKQSLRMELQHLYSDDIVHGHSFKSWAAALLEFNVAPRWSFSVQDMWNYGETGMHYINGSVSYSYSRVRAALNFGRFRAGYLCSGGVCRMTPAYTGANLSLVVTL